MSYVYKHIRLDNNQTFYIGIGSDENYKRAYSKKDRNKHWHNTVNLTEYLVEIISDEWLTWEEACEKEKFWIIFYGRADLGTGSLVNMTDGGDGQYGFKHSEKTKLVYKVSRKGHKVSDITRKKIKESNIGKKRSEETKLRIKKSKQGKQLSLEHRESISKSQKNRVKSKLERLNISKSLKGKPKSEEHKRKLSKSKMGNTDRLGIKNPKIQCPYCEKFGGNNGMKQWHFDKCKYKQK